MKSYTRLLGSAALVLTATAVLAQDAELLVYDYAGFDNPDFLGWGRAATEADGTYLFRTIKPGGREPSINFLLLYSGLMRQLHTVMYFEPGEHPEKLVAKKEGANRYRFDIRLRGEGETPFFED